MRQSRFGFGIVGTGMIAAFHAKAIAAMADAELVAVHARRIESAQESQEDGQEQFKDALEQFQAVVNFDGGEVQDIYEKLNVQNAPADVNRGHQLGLLSKEDSS